MVMIRTCQPFGHCFNMTHKYQHSPAICILNVFKHAFLLAVFFRYINDDDGDDDESMVIVVVVYAPCAADHENVYLDWS